MTDESDLKLQKVLLERLQEDLKALNELVTEKYVLLLIFEGHKQYIDQRLKPLERLTYGLVSIVLATVVTSIMYLVIRK